MKHAAARLMVSFMFCAGIGYAQIPLSDTKATKETRALYSNLQKVQGKGVIFGHHDDTAYGIGWALKDSSDVKAVAGTYPALYGWDVAKMEHDSTNDINGVPFETQRKLIQEAYQRGGINTICWHMDNPVNGQNAWDTTQNSVKNILPGGPNNEEYKDYLKHVARYLKTLKGKDGEAIPVLFRPFHELTGDWFWWGAKTTTPQDFIALWQYTIDFLRKKQKLHHLVIVYSTADFNSEQEFLERYPGDGYVDVMGFDLYCTKNVDQYTDRLHKQLGILQTVADAHHKLMSIPETGYQSIPDANWWTNVLLPQLIKFSKLSYIMAWRNATKEHFFAPYPGQVSAADFVRFSQNPNIIFQNRITPLNIYGKAVNE